MSQLVWLNETLSFPSTEDALDDPNGLLAVGGDLSPERLVQAYKLGIFPWYCDGQPILWWSPSPRMILPPQQLHLGRSNRKLLKKHPYEVKVDTAFEQVIQHCSNVDRGDQEGTWITEEMMDAYCHLHTLGYAHSIESWHGEDLVGGLYGVAVGQAFFGESMFSLESGASKVAFIHLVKKLQSWDYKLVDCQIHTDYLASFGAVEVNRQTFESLLTQAVNAPPKNDWQQHWPSFGAKSD